MCFKLILSFVLLASTCIAQESQTYKVRTIVFYNVENLFDTENDSLTFDDEYTPAGKNRWTLPRYEDKIAHISTVLIKIGLKKKFTSPDIIGLSEIENVGVLQDLVKTDILQKQAYGIVHYDSPDRRGIDVALLYNKDAFIPISFQSRRLLLENHDGNRKYTRDQLVVCGKLDQEDFCFIVNHWPSRSGGATKSKPHRMAAAQLNKKIIDFTTNILGPQKEGYQFWKAGVFAPTFLKTDKGRYKGYPFRTLTSGVYTGGFSDHFPIYMVLIKPLSGHEVVSKVSTPD